MKFRELERGPIEGRTEDFDLPGGLTVKIRVLPLLAGRDREIEAGAAEYARSVNAEPKAGEPSYERGIYAWTVFLAVRDPEDGQPFFASVAEMLDPDRGLDRDRLAWLFEVQQQALEQEAEKVMAEQGRRVSYKFGTMIEIPRAALTADELARFAQFFSFGTNDLTQLPFGISRDDAEKGFLLEYLSKAILPENPFASIDEPGVGKLMKMAVELGRKTRPGMEIGICGEHGGDPKSIAFCHKIGLDYVSCSPFRIPIARLAAAQAALKERGVTAK